VLITVTISTVTGLGAPRPETLAQIPPADLDVPVLGQLPPTDLPFDNAHEPGPL